MTDPSPPMRIMKDAYVVLDYVLYDEDGDVIEATDDEGGRPIGFVQGYGSLVAGLEDGIVGMAAGETKELLVPPHDAYGEHDDALEHWVDKTDFPPDVALDDEFEAEDEDGRPMTLRVIEVGDDAVLIDANHPLAGEELRFEVMIRSVRPATASELKDARSTAPKPRLMLAPDGPAAAPPTPASVPSGQDGGTQPTDKALRKEPASAPAAATSRSPATKKAGTSPAELDDEQ